MSNLRRSKSVDRISRSGIPMPFGRRCTSVERGSLAPPTISAPHSGLRRGRISPHSNVRGRLTTTPLMGRQSFVPQSASTLDRKMLVENKNMQKQAATRLANVLTQLQVPVKFTKPLIVGQVLSIFEALANELGVRAFISKGNYVAKIPEIMKLLDYPYTITASTLKTVHSGHSHVQILHIFTYLINLIDAQNNPVLPYQGLSKRERISATYLTFLADCFNNDNANLAECAQKLFTQVCDIRNLVPEEIDEGERKLEEMRRECEAFDRECEELEEECKMREQMENELQNNEDEACRTMSKTLVDADKVVTTLEREVAVDEANLAKLKQQKLDGIYTQRNLDDIKFKIEHLKGTLKIVEDSIKESDTKFNELWTKTMSVECKLKSKTAWLNNQLVKISKSEPLVHGIRLPPNGTVTEEHMQELQSKLAAIKKSTNVEVLELQREKTKLESDHKEDIVEVKLLMLEIADLQDKVATLTRQKNFARQAKVEKYDEIHLEHRNLSHKLEHLQTEEDTLTKKLEADNAQLKTLEESRDMLVHKRDTERNNFVRDAIEAVKMYDRHANSLAVAMYERQCKLVDKINRFYDFKGDSDLQLL